MISYDTWQRRLGGASDVVGKTIHVDGEPRTILGVMPQGFSLIPWVDDVAFWIGGRSLARFGSRGQQRLGVLAPKLAESDVITTEARVRDIYDKNGMKFYVFESESRNQDGATTVKGTWTNIVRGG